MFRPYIVSEHFWVIKYLSKVEGCNEYSQSIMLSFISYLSVFEKNRVSIVLMQIGLYTDC